MTCAWFRATVVMLCCLALSSSAFGWDDEGHMAVAAVAYQRLSPAKQKRVAELLKLNPDYHTWLSRIPAGTPAKDQPRVLFMIAATWPDQIRREPGYSDDGTQHGDRPDGASSSQNIGYRDKLRHKYWHFVDTPFTQDGTALGKAPSPNAQTQIAAFRKTLSGNAPDDVKSYDLVWLLHLTGDVHQPLHCAARYTKTAPTGDAGGNLVALCQKPCKQELHAFWDDLLGTSSDPEAAVRVAAKLPKPDPALSAKLDEAAWVQESFQSAQKDVYVAPIGDGEGPFTLTPAYKAAAKKLAQQRVALAGARLAAVINAELK